MLPRSMISPSARSLKALFISSERDSNVARIWAYTVLENGSNQDQGR